METLLEFHVNKSLFDEVKNDPNLRVGFELEFIVRNASDLLQDESGDLPYDFRTYNFFDEPGHTSIDDSPDMYHAEVTMMRVARLVEKYLKLPENEISLEDTGYTQWKIEIDTSLYPKQGSIEDVEDDMGIELVTPVMPFRQGMIVLYQLLEMIHTFKYGRISFNTNQRTGLHINLSHTNMLWQFDYAKLAILAGDEHYLNQFARGRNPYARPLLQAVTNALVAAREGKSDQNPRQTQAALGLLRLRGWSAERVMLDLSKLVPTEHHASLDLSRVTDRENPYVEVRIAGNQFYERRYDAIATMAVRFAALIKIACDPDAYREEYLKKVYQLVSGISTATADPTQAAQKDPFIKIRLYLRPVLTTQKPRAALDLMQNWYMSGKLSAVNGSYVFLALVRGALDARQAQSLRVRQGLNIILYDVLRSDPKKIIKSLNNPEMLKRYEVIRAGDRPAQILAMCTNYLKSLGGGVLSNGRNAQV